MRQMSTYLRTRTAGLLLALMLATLLSPATGWAMVADHHELEHAAVLSGADEGEEHEHGNGAHSWFGHLLGHLPAAFCSVPLIALASTIESKLPDLSAPSPIFLPDPPLRPPLACLS
jgi:hypothetical protein